MVAWSPDQETQVEGIRSSSPQQCVELQELGTIAHKATNMQATTIIM